MQGTLTAFFKRKPEVAPDVDGDDKAPKRVKGAGDAVPAPRVPPRIAAPPSERCTSFLSLQQPDWKAALATEAGKPYFASLVDFVEAERARGPVYPPTHQVFAAFDASPLECVRVVVIGQDPYHGDRQAHGLAFSVQDTTACKFPPSLRNIFQECRDDPDVNFSQGASCARGAEGSLARWASQGVLLLNTVLTVAAGRANSHQKMGWEQFTDAAVRAVLNRPGKGCVFLLWGLPAKKKVPAIDSKRHRVITSSHPSPLSNTKGPEPFSGSRCFSRCNKLLQDLGHEPIDWST